MQENNLIKLLDNVKCAIGFIERLPKEIPYLMEFNTVRINEAMFVLKDSENIIINELDKVYSDE